MAFRRARVCSWEGGGGAGGVGGGVGGEGGTRPFIHDV